MLQSFAKKIIKQTEHDYDRIADQFSHTRAKLWPELQQLTALLKPSQRILDIGCGNGRLAEIAVKIKCAYVGIDFSKKLLNHAKQRYPELQFIYGSMLRLPVEDEEFDVVTAIASLQHIPSEQFRLQALQELAHVAKPDGILFMTNWNLQQDKFLQYRVSPKDGYDADDFIIPWKNDQGEILAQRYYHGFIEAELKTLLPRAGWTIIKQTITDRNIITIAKKMKIDYTNGR